MKCLPASKLAQAHGSVIHDWHAEILAVRAFNLFILEECRRLASDPAAESQYLRRRSQTDREASLLKHPFAWRNDVSLHMYCSEAPCGDASMELIMAAQEDASPWAVPADVLAPPSPKGDVTDLTVAGEPAANPVALPGRAYFSHLGVVRRKPARADAPPTLSKSCSDKIALKQCTSLLCSLTSLLVMPSKSLYLASIVLPQSQFSAEACARAFSAQGRMSASAESSTGDSWTESGYGFVGFEVVTTRKGFAFSKRAIDEQSGELEQGRLVASNLAVALTCNGSPQGEGLVGGVLQGRKQMDPKGASLVSRRKMWALAKQVASLAGLTEVKALLESETYGAFKEGELLEARRAVKAEARRVSLRGWVRNEGDDGFSL